jgi:hypothetical protein
MCSHQVPNVMLKLLPKAPHFYPICFAKSCPLFTYAAGPKGLALLHLPIESFISILQSIEIFSFFHTKKKEIRKKELENTLEIIGETFLKMWDRMKTTKSATALM